MILPECLCSDCLPAEPPHFDEHNLFYAQAQHLELEFYDQFFEPGAYLQTHAEHMERWHTPHA